MHVQYVTVFKSLLLQTLNFYNSHFLLETRCTSSPALKFDLARIHVSYCEILASLFNITVILWINSLKSRLA